jgi:hypothetical protein
VSDAAAQARKNADRTKKRQRDALSAADDRTTVGADEPEPVVMEPKVANELSLKSDYKRKRTRPLPKYQS